MVTEFVIGKHYKLIGSFPGDELWGASMEKMIGVKQLCDLVSLFGNGLMVSYDENGAIDHQHGLWYRPEWMEEWAKPIAIVEEEKCECNVMSGCSCGVMARNMAARGLVKDPISGLWVQEDEQDTKSVKGEAADVVDLADIPNCNVNAFQAALDQIMRDIHRDMLRDMFIASTTSMESFRGIIPEITK